MIIVSIIYSFKNSKIISSNKGTGKLYKISVVLIHIQFLLGIILYFISPKVSFNSDSFAAPLVRFFTIEHTLMMVLAIILFTIGNAKFKKEPKAKKAHRKVLLYFSLGFIIMILSIPWPFYNFGTLWM
jgi:preprotein translocase subunit SecG